MSEYNQQSQVLLLFRYFSKHPALALSIAYALLTLCGILYSSHFYDEFNISILKLANVSDLLISGLSEPAALLMFAGGLLVAISFDVFSKYTHRIQSKWRAQPKSFKRSLVLAVVYTPKKSEYVMLSVVSMFILYGYLFVLFFAQWHSKRIKDGHGEQIVIFSESLGTQSKQMTLLGATTGFLFAYDKNIEQAVILPIENIDKIHAPADEPKTDE